MKTSSSWKKWKRSSVALFSIFTLIFTTHAETNDLTSAAELKRLSLEELLNQDVTIVSRREEKVLQSPSAVQVITQEDIRRAGATSLPEALRLAPNLQVAQINSSQWAVGARGFNTTTANKLLVMIDGRTVYTPLFSGVFWDVQDTLMEDIDRIEVVSGPGATLWGANAVNGVINVITKSAKDTQGTLITGGGGTFLKDFVGVRYGGQIGSNIFFRVYGKYFDRDNTLLANGRDGTNAWRMAQTGFRMDWMPSAENTVTVQGDIYGGDEEMPAPGDTTLNGQNLLARWTHVVSQDSDFRLQVYADRTWRNIPGTFGENFRTYDIDFSHRFQLGERQAITWGAGYRLMQDEVKNTATLAFIPPNRDMQLFSGFLQDEIVLVPEKLKLTLGTKLEHNDFSGFELQPSARLAWLVDKRQALWAAVSRAVRSPSRIDTDLFVPGQAPFFIAGDKSFTSEKLIAYEVGYHIRPVDRWSISVATYYNQYDDIRSVETNGASLAIQNGLQGQSWGAEISTDFQVSDWWRLRGGYTYFHKDVWEKPDHADFSNAKGEGNDPHHQFLLQSMLNLPLNLEFDVTARYVSSLPDPRVPEYFTFDARLAWHWKKNLEVAVIGQNLWDNQHPEFGAAAGRQEIPRSVYGKVSLRF